MAPGLMKRVVNAQPEWNRLLERVFRTCPFEDCHPIGIWRRVIDHTIAGALLGILVLHPLSMIAHNFFHLDTMRIREVLWLSFSYAHIPMIIYFVLVGAIFGLVHGSYIHIISKLHEEIRILAISDELTGLYNRRFFMNRLEQEVARTQRYGHCLSLLMIDIDFFKHFNDTHGHPAGDELLRRLGELFRELIRESDFAARYGGEEFVIVMPETESEMAHTLARRICAAVSTYPFRHQETQPGGSVTVSMGLAELPATAQTMEELIKNADQALYDAKNMGKNRVCQFLPADPRYDVAKSGGPV